MIIVSQLRGTFHGNWEEFTKHFSRYFSTQGHNIKHLYERWRTFSFDPANDDIEEYIRDVKEAAKQLGHGDDAVVNLLKATMPTELYGTLYGHNNLPLLCTMLKDIYAKKPQPTAATPATTTPGATAPFTLLRTPVRTPLKHAEEPSLEEKVNHLTEALYQMDLEGKPVKKPFKPFLTQPRRKFKGNFDKGCNGWNGHFGSFNRRDRCGRFGNRGSFKPRRPFGRFDKSPNTKRFRVSGRPINKDKSRCFKCKEFGHFQDECPTNKPSQEESSRPKEFEDYTYTYSGPDIQPQMQINSVNPNGSSTYDQALGVIKDSLNTANPLASLNL